MNRVNVFAIHRCINEGYGLIRIFTEKIRISPTKLWRVCVCYPIIGAYVYMYTGTLDKINTSAVFEIALVRLSETSDYLLGQVNNPLAVLSDK